MGHSIGDGIIVIAICAAIAFYFYLKHLRHQRRLEVLHAERVAAMDKGIPLPELPIDPPAADDPWAQHIPVVLGILLAAAGFGTMAALMMLSPDDVSKYWPLPLPLGLMGLGLLLAHHLIAGRKR